MISKVTNKEVGEVGGLTEALIKKQEGLGLSDTAFARKLNISRSMWYQVKNGRREPGRDILRKIIKEFPDLQLLVFQYLTEGDR
ncbi:MAG: helix-turn-helix transcriptional regulator [Dehalococcoidales bacterium]|nr:helix-turn-helix transcriptional regulator [Dehalococcoidales bacterium]